MTFTGGRQERSYVSVTGSDGEGAFAAASWGRKGQYGFSLQVPKVPVSIAIYVHEDDARNVSGRAIALGRRLVRDAAGWGRAAVGWGEGATKDSAAFAQHAFGVVRAELSGAGNEVQAAFESAALDTGIFFTRSSNTLVVGVKSAAGTTEAFFTGTAEQVEQAFVNTTGSVEGAMAAAAGDVVQFGATVGSAVSTAVDDTVNAIEQAGNAVAGGVGGAVNAVVGFFNGLF